MLGRCLARRTRAGAWLIRSSVGFLELLEAWQLVDNIVNLAARLNLLSRGRFLSHTPQKYRPLNSPPPVRLPGAVPFDLLPLDRPLLHHLLCRRGSRVHRELRLLRLEFCLQRRDLGFSSPLPVGFAFRAWRPARISPSRCSSRRSSSAGVSPSGDSNPLIPAALRRQSISCLRSSATTTPALADAIGVERPGFHIVKRDKNRHNTHEERYNRHKTH
jgi:hypothetical protein